MSRTGRPKSDNPKSYKINVRMDANLGNRLDKYADKTGKVKTQIIREAIVYFLDKEEK